MENVELELGDVNKMQASVQSLLDCVRKEDNHMNPCSPSICLVPSVLRDLSPSSFEPKMVSIGPLHREDKNVQAFEGKKISYLINLMSRINSPQEDILKSCMKKAYTSMNKIKTSYIWTKTYDDAEIAKMMVMDACFILEFMHRIWQSGQILFGNALQVQTIYSDLLLLENQIPFFFLDQIFQCTILRLTSHAPSLIKLVSPVLSFHVLFDAYISTDDILINTTHHHILSLLHECYKPGDDIVATHSDTIVIPSAMDLDRAGMNFKPNQNPTWVMGMEVKLSRFSCLSWWCGKPTLRMPIFLVRDVTGSVLRNLIAYEQTFQTKGYVTSYATIMDMLMNNEKDVGKLVDSKVLQNFTGSNEEAANIINNITKDAAPLGFYYDDVCQTLINYYDGYWPRNIAWLRRTYFNNPWNIIVLLAGIILFALTMIQTFFTIRPIGSNNGE